MIKYEFSAGCVVFKNNNGKINFLIVQHERGHWSFPKGHIELGETAKETALRETREETGLKVKIIKDLKYVEFFFRNKAKNLVLKKVHFFLAKAKPQDKVKLSFEFKDFKWLAYHDAKRKITYKNDKQLLEKAFNELKKRTQ